MSGRARAWLRGVSAGVLAAAAVAGCRHAASGRVVLRLAVPNVGERMRRPFREALARFEAAHPGVRVQLLEMSDEIYQQMGLATLFTGGTPPDVYFQWGGFGVRRYAAAGYALDLTPRLDAAERDRYYPGCWRSCSGADGRLYLWPDSASISTLFWYRRGDLRRLGLRAPESWDALLRCGERFRAAGMIPIAVGNRELWPGGNLGAYLAAQYAGVAAYNDILGLRPGRRLDDPRFVAALGRLAELRERGFLNRGVNGTGTDDARSLFTQGRAALHPIGDWLVTDAPEAEVRDLDSFRLPHCPGQAGKDGTLLGLTTGYMINRRTPHAELGAALLRFITRDEVQREWTKYGHLSAVRGAAPGPSAPAGMRRLAWFLTSAPESAVAPDVGFDPEVSDAFMDAVSRVLAGRSTPGDALAGAERQVAALRR